MTTLGHFIFTGILEALSEATRGYLSNPTPAGCRFGWVAWMITHTGAIASWARSEKLRMLSERILYTPVHYLV